MNQYPGGKNGPGVWHRIINQQPPHRVYIEPFLGSGAVMRRKRPAKVNIGVDLLLEAVGEIAAASEQVKLPSRSAQAEPPPRAAVGSSTVPRVQALSPSPDDVDDSAAGRRKSQALSPPNAIDSGGVGTFPAGTVGILGCGIQFLEDYDWKGDELVYCDPPYLLNTGRRYYLHHQVDHRRLLRLLRQLPCAVQLSGYESDLYKNELAGWRVLTFQATTRGGLRTEWLWMNYPEPARLHTYWFVGEDKRRRQDFRRMQQRWQRRLIEMPTVKRYALFAALDEIRDKE